MKKNLAPNIGSKIIDFLFFQGFIIRFPSYYTKNCSIEQCPKYNRAEISKIIIAVCIGAKTTFSILMWSSLESNWLVLFIIMLERGDTSYLDDLYCIKDPTTFF